MQWLSFLSRFRVARFVSTSLAIFSSSLSITNLGRFSLPAVFFPFVFHKMPAIGLLYSSPPPGVSFRVLKRTTPLVAPCFFPTTKTLRPASLLRMGFSICSPFGSFGLIFSFNDSILFCMNFSLAPERVFQVPSLLSACGLRIPFLVFAHNITVEAESFCTGLLFYCLPFISLCASFDLFCRPVLGSPSPRRS